MSETFFTVYILYSAVVDRYFTGKTTQFSKQLERHNSGRNAHTKSGIPWKAVLIERYASKKESDKRLEELRGSRSREELIGAIRSERNEI
jgi:putative endonuclease